jgi:hypothetical protein
MATQETLRDYLRNNNAIIEETRMLNWARQIIWIIKMQEAHGIAIIPETLMMEGDGNLILVSENKGDGDDVTRVGGDNWGDAPTCAPGNVGNGCSFIQRSCISWYAPELFNRELVLSSEIDVYGFGMTLWQIVSYGKEPYYGHNIYQVYGHIKGGGRETIPENAPSWAREIIEKCWLHNANARITMEGIEELLDQYELSLFEQSEEITTY